VPDRHERKENDMKRTIGAIALIGGVMATAAAMALAGTAAFAGTNAVESSQKRIHAEWDRSRAQGGYGVPLTAIPAAIASAFTGKDSAVTASRALSSQDNFTAPDESRGGDLTGHWVNKYSTGRAYDHAER
jgi:hypothetical protein